MSTKSEIKATLKPAVMGTSFFNALAKYEENANKLRLEYKAYKIELDALEKDADGNIPDETKKPVRKAYSDRTKKYRSAMSSTVKAFCDDTKSDDKRNLFTAVYDAYVAYKHADGTTRSKAFSQYVNDTVNLLSVRCYKTTLNKATVRKIVERIDDKCGMKLYTLSAQVKYDTSAVDVYQRKDYEKMWVWSMAQLVRTGEIVVNDETMEELVA